MYLIVAMFVVVGTAADEAKETPPDDQPRDDDSAPPSHSKLAAYFGRPYCHQSCDLKFCDNK